MPKLLLVILTSVIAVSHLLNYVTGTPLSSTQLYTSGRTSEDPFANAASPPSLIDPPPDFDDGTGCKTDCIDERLDDCTTCFSTPSDIATCHTYITHISTPDLLSPSPSTKASFYGLLDATRTSVCAGSVIYLADFALLKEKSAKNSTPLLKLPPAEELSLIAVEHKMREVLEAQNLEADVTESSIELTESDSDEPKARSNNRNVTKYKWNLSINILTKRQLRRYIIRRELNILSGKSGYEDLARNDNFEFEIKSEEVKGKYTHYVIIVSLDPNSVLSQAI